MSVLKLSIAEDEHWINHVAMSPFLPISPARRPPQHPSLSAIPSPALLPPHILQQDFFIPCFALFKAAVAPAISTFKALGNKQIKLFLHVFPPDERCAHCMCRFPGSYLLSAPSETLHEYKNVKHRRIFLLILGFVKNTLRLCHIELKMDSTRKLERDL